MTATAPSFAFPPPYVPPPPTYGVAYRYATLGSRFTAALVDLILLGIVAVLIALPFGLIASVELIATGRIDWVGSFLFGPMTALPVLLALAYFSYFESTSGQTPGKSAVGIRVISLATQRPPDLSHALIRNIIRVLDWLPAFYLLGYMIADSSPRSQRLGDQVAGTIVVRA